MSGKIQVAGEEQASCDFEDGCSGLAVEQESDEKSQAD